MNQSPKIKDDIEAIEQALISQWSIYGHAPGGAWHKESDLVWAEAPISQLPYNAVVWCQIDDRSLLRIDQVIQHFRNREVQFMWIVHPTARPVDLVDHLEARGLSHAEDVTGMALDLSGWKPVLEIRDSPVVYQEVNDEESRRLYDDLLLTYWELPSESHFYAVGMSEWSQNSGVPGMRWVAILEGEPVGKVYLSLMGSEDTASIFGVFVKPQARGYGIAGILSQLAISRAKALGLKRVVLHSSAMALNIYKKLGFEERCTLQLYGTTALHSPQL